jgi:hypothetical protein
MDRTKYFLSYFHKNVVSIRLIERRKSPLMWSIHLFLNFLNLFLKLFNKPLLAKGDFLGNYVTTIGNRIYATPKWSETMGISKLITHELTHVVQFYEYGFLKFSFKYLISKKFRLFAESEAFQAECACFPLVLQSDDMLNRKARSLVSYGLRLKVIERELMNRLIETRMNKLKKCSQIVYDSVQQWRKSTRS